MPFDTSSVTSSWHCGRSDVSEPALQEFSGSPAYGHFVGGVELEEYLNRFSRETEGVSELTIEVMWSVHSC